MLTNLKRKLPVARYHIIWAVFYMLLLGGSVTFAGYLYNEYDQDRLPAGYIELTLNKEQYELGEEVVFTVSNHFPTTVYVTNHCPKEPLNVYQWQDNVWVQLHAKADEDGECYGQERSVAIPPEGVRSYNFNDWQTLFTEPGVYRIAMVIDNYSEIPFQDFVVLATPETIIVEEPVPVPTTPTVATPIVTDMPEPDVIVTPEVEEELIEEILEEWFEDDDEEEEEEEDEREEREHENEEEDDD